MTAIGQPERATQNRVLTLFRNELGYRCKWQIHRQVLNRLPVQQETWSY